MTANQFRKLALSLPGVVESSHFHHPDFRVRNKIFATLGYPDERWGMIKLTPDQQAVYRQAFRPFGLFTHGQTHFDKNDFLVRPAPLGNFTKEHDIRSYYLGWTGDGHIGPLNVNHAFYHVLGRDTFNNLAGRPLDINAQMAAMELSMDFDWLRP